MAVISKTRMTVNGKEFVKVVKVDSHGNFTIELPPEARAALNQNLVDGNTAAEANKKFDKMIEDYLKMKTTESKVIVYAYKAHCDFERLGPHKEGESSWVKMDSLSFGDGVGLAICAAVYIKRTRTKEDGEAHSEYAWLESSIPDDVKQRNRIYVRTTDNDDCDGDEQEILWTAEREAFFAKLGESMHTLIVNIRAIGKPEAMIQFIDSGRMIEAPKEQKKGKA